MSKQRSVLMGKFFKITDDLKDMEKDIKKISERMNKKNKNYECLEDIQKTLLHKVSKTVKIDETLDCIQNEMNNNMDDIKELDNQIVNIKNTTIFLDEKLIAVGQKGTNLAYKIYDLESKHQENTQEYHNISKQRSILMGQYFEISDELKEAKKNIKKNN
ncbi:hypothetical protein RF11_16410 [Thelohanellus kitauei]|uniref:Uncharacterized protein n=1 Tax=Thelohanellus kitauei TaxID=669202 RepID=A0A0C2IE93_THEKT|nr:hypothetical protein RF11_16410 [Thelohanellus kitauei]